MLHVIDDGVSALHCDSETGDVVIKDHGFTSELRGVVCRVAPKVCRLLGFDGYMSLRHMCLIAQLLHEMGYESAYRRHELMQPRPWGEVVTYGFWAGEVHIDVRKLPHRSTSYES